MRGCGAKGKENKKDQEKDVHFFFINFCENQVTIKNINVSVGAYNSWQGSIQEHSKDIVNGFNEAKKIAI